MAKPSKKTAIGAPTAAPAIWYWFQPELPSFPRVLLGVAMGTEVRVLTTTVGLLVNITVLLTLSDVATEIVDVGDDVDGVPM